MTIVSPGTAGLDWVINDPATLAQQVCVLVAVRLNSTPEVFVITVDVVVVTLMPSPSVPAISPERDGEFYLATEAVTSSEALALIKVTNPNSMLARESVALTV